MTGEKREGGFSLIEAAIVLAVIGLVVGGIWIAAAKARKTHNLNKDYALVLSGVEKTRSLFRYSLRVGSMSVGFSSKVSTQMGIIPSDLIKGTQAYSYSGYEMDLPSTVSDNGGIAVMFHTVDKAGCIWLLSRFSQNAAVQFMWVYDQDFNYTNYSRDPADGAQWPLPASVTQIEGVLRSSTECDEIGFNFKW